SWLCARLCSVACQSGVISLARCNRISGTRGGTATTVFARTNVAGSGGSGTGEPARADRTEQQRPADYPVGAEFREAILGIPDVDPCGLPGHLQRREGETDIVRPRDVATCAGGGPERGRKGVEREKPRTRPLSERQGRGFDTDENVVLLVLVRVD